MPWITKNSSFFLRQVFSEYDQTAFFLADVRNRDKLSRKMKGVDVMFHAAAFKHVIFCERSPLEAVQTNILGVHNIIYTVIEKGVKTVIFTSSDKVVNPTNVKGTSKLICECLITAGNSKVRTRGAVLASTRFCNVYGPGSGRKNSVIAKLIRQTIEGEVFEIFGDGNQTRDFIFIDDLVRAIRKAVSPPTPGPETRPFVLSPRSASKNSDLTSHFPWGETFQIATIKEYTVNEMVDTTDAILWPEDAN